MHVLTYKWFSLVKSGNLFLAYMSLFLVWPVAIAKIKNEFASPKKEVKLKVCQNHGLTLEHRKMCFGYFRLPAYVPYTKFFSGKL